LGLALFAPLPVTPKPAFAYNQACSGLPNGYNRNNRTKGWQRDGDRNALILNGKFSGGGIGGGKSVSGIRHMQRNCHM
jgi:hypothetical protein